MSVDITNSMLTEKALDYAKLSSLAYAEWNKNNGVLVEGQPKYDYYLGLWTELYNKGYRFIDYCPNNPDTGYSGTIFEYQGKKILANRGTEFSEWPPVVEGDFNDYKADWEVYRGYTPAEQFTTMVEFIAKHNDLGVFDVTGHSLGGCLAQMAKATYGSAIDQVYTYNSLGAAELSANYKYLAVNSGDITLNSSLLGAGFFTPQQTSR